MRRQIEPSGIPTTFFDVRDGKTCPVVRLADRNWLARNLDHFAPESWCYDNDEAHCARLGRLYSWASALQICPTGWHLPTDDEWTSLANTFGGYWELSTGRPVGDPTRSYEALLAGGTSNFEALLAGSRGLIGGKSVDLNEDGVYWGSTTCGSDSTLYVVFNAKHRRVLRDCWKRDFAASVRCVQDS
jgi:uncharacterized protein (TIGR02145 family)